MYVTGVLWYNSAISWVYYDFEKVNYKSFRNTKEGYCKSNIWVHRPFSMDNQIAKEDCWKHGISLKFQDIVFSFA